MVVKKDSKNPNIGKRPIGIDLFAGAGGLSLGFEQAGFDIVAAVELDPIHATTHMYNFPECAIIPRSVIGLKGTEIRSFAGIENREIDVVFGGPPCQGFSMIGKRALDDPRNTLVKEFVRLVTELGAEYFVFENVKGLTIGNQVRFLDEVILEFRKNGYEIRLPWKVLNANSYNVPQDRKRLFLFGAKIGFPLPEYPLPTTVPASETIPFSDLPSTPTCFDALSDLPEVEDFRELLRHDSVRTRKWSPVNEYAKELHCSQQRAWHYGYRRVWDRRILTASMRTNHTEISRNRFRKTKKGEIEPISRFFKLSEGGLCNTLRAGTDSARGAFTSPRPIHYEKARCITVREMARIHGFPDWFRFHVTKWHGARQIGNAVPPPLGRAVASQVLNALGIKAEKPGRIKQLGDPSLLSMDMTRAARFLGISVPISKRDRKNGLRKRKQHQIESE